MHSCSTLRVKTISFLLIWSGLILKGQLKVILSLLKLSDFYVDDEGSKEHIHLSVTAIYIERECLVQ